ncbi:lysine/ornithine decarboxylase [Actinoplanes ianthinogenes]|uniref:ornithine decarboxylase n=1 Tax=Actinoplanes ianthinogenes TaxID=122358 RepID=A0ABN6C8Y4_9ACTN|nr:type III PLP-dependent enzyme [Actinoplanes ianthinogenes]BCJ41148.1 lysine/ornithine decarboxylase [Actinoplanes ianthinogenes]GGR22574.1 lysine/ornithine decarboxylase [Actinoplanes ianthinogenes]
MRISRTLRDALAAAGEDQIVFDLDAVEESHARLLRDLPGVAVRFAVKACPVDEVLDALAGGGAGFDTAGLGEIRQALRTGAAPDVIHYGNAVKSDRDIGIAHRLGIRDFATDSVADVRAVAEHAPGARVFCRISTSGAGALWGLQGKNGCSVPEAVTVLETARDRGLVPAGLSLHVGSQQMSTAAWRAAADDLAHAIALLRRRGIRLDHVNLGGGLPALGYLDRRGVPLRPPIDGILAEIRDGVGRLRRVAGTPLEFVLEPGRHLVADHGAIRAHVVRLTARRQRFGRRPHWLYLSCGKFNGLYEMDQLQYRLEFPGHRGGPTVPAVIAGPTCDSDDAFDAGHPMLVPADLRSGDPVWILAAGAYSVSYRTVGFNGFDPLPHRAVRAHLPALR